MVIFLEHGQQELYLVMVHIPRIPAMVETSLTSGYFSLNGSASSVMHKIALFGVFTTDLFSMPGMNIIGGNNYSKFHYNYSSYYPY